MKCLRSLRDAFSKAFDVLPWKSSVTYAVCVCQVSSDYHKHEYLGDKGNWESNLKLKILNLNNNYYVTIHQEDERSTHWAT